MVHRRTERLGEGGGVRWVETEMGGERERGRMADVGYPVYMHVDGDLPQRDFLDYLESVRFSQE